MISIACHLWKIRFLCVSLTKKSRNSWMSNLWYSVIVMKWLWAHFNRVKDFMDVKSISSSLLLLVVRFEVVKECLNACEKWDFVWKTRKTFCNSRSCGATVLSILSEKQWIVVANDSSILLLNQYKWIQEGLVSILYQSQEYIQ